MDPWAPPPVHSLQSHCPPSAFFLFTCYKSPHQGLGALEHTHPPPENVLFPLHLPVVTQTLEVASFHEEGLGAEEQLNGRGFA